MSLAGCRCAAIYYSRSHVTCELFLTDNGRHRFCQSIFFYYSHNNGIKLLEIEKKRERGRAEELTIYQTISVRGLSKINILGYVISV